MFAAKKSLFIGHWHFPFVSRFSGGELEIGGQSLGHRALTIRVARFFSIQHTKTGKNICISIHGHKIHKPNGHKNTKWPQNIPNKP
jgi:hypothetical protein